MTLLQINGEILYDDGRVSRVTEDEVYVSQLRQVTNIFTNVVTEPVVDRTRTVTVLQSICFYFVNVHLSKVFVFRLHSRSILQILQWLTTDITVRTVFSFSYSHLVLSLQFPLPLRVHRLMVVRLEYLHSFLTNPVFIDGVGSPVSIRDTSSGDWSLSKEVKDITYTVYDSKKTQYCTFSNRSGAIPEIYTSFVL